MDAAVIGNAVDLSARRFESLPEATQAVLKVLEEALPDSLVFAGLLDEVTSTFWIIGARGDESFGVEAGSSVALHESFCVHMANDRAPRLCNDAAADPVYSTLAPQGNLDIGSYVGVPLEVADGNRVGSLCAISHGVESYTQDHLNVLMLMSRLLTHEIERERRECDLQQVTDVLREQALTDPLTGLANRRAFERELDREAKVTARHGVDSHVVVADLDGFKAVNDRHGHAVGDQALIDVSIALRRATRETDVVGRLGGDEFGAILVHSTALEIDAFHHRVRAELAAVLADRPYRFGVSVGIASLRAAASPEAALEAADEAMYREKTSAPARRTPAEGRVPLRAS